MNKILTVEAVDGGWKVEARTPDGMTVVRRSPDARARASRLSASPRPAAPGAARTSSRGGAEYGLHRR